MCQVLHFSRRLLIVMTGGVGDSCGNNGHCGWRHRSHWLKYAQIRYQGRCQNRMSVRPGGQFIMTPLFFREHTNLLRQVSGEIREYFLGSLPPTIQSKTTPVQCAPLPLEASCTTRILSPSRDSRENQQARKSLHSPCQ